MSLQELRDVYDDEIEEFSEEYKDDILKKIEVPPERKQIIKFLYLNGDEYSWNWGRNGMTNAVFLSNGARDFLGDSFNTRRYY